MNTYICRRNMIILQSEKYQLGTEGIMSCPRGTIVVEDELECRDSADQFGKQMLPDILCYGTEFPGCFDNGASFIKSTCHHPMSTHSVRSVVCKRKYDI